MANEITPLEIRSGESEAFLVTRRYRLEVWCSFRTLIRELESPAGRSRPEGNLRSIRWTMEILGRERLTYYNERNKDWSSTNSSTSSLSVQSRLQRSNSL